MSSQASGKHCVRYSGEAPLALFLLRQATQAPLRVERRKFRSASRGSRLETRNWKLRDKLFLSDSDNLFWIVSCVYS